MAQTKAQLLGPVVGDVVMDVSTLSLDAEGNKVGIGTTGATATLHVFEPTEGDAVLQFNSGDNFPTVNRGLVIKSATGPTGYTGSKWIFDAQSSGGRIEFQTASSPRLTILETGKIFIGSTNEYGPTGQLLSNKGLIVTSDGENSLKIVDTTAAASNVGASILLGGNYRSSGDTQSFVRLKSFKENATDNNYAYGFSVSTTSNGGSFAEALRITSGGNLGVGNDGSFPIYTGTNDRTLILGTGSEDSAIQIHSGTSNYGGLYFGDATSGSNRYRGYIEFKHGTNDDFLRFGTGATERLRIHADGEVECKGGAAGQNALLVTGNYSSGNNVDIQTWQRTGGAVQAKIGYKDADTSMFFGTDTAHSLAIITGGTERLRIDSLGSAQFQGQNAPAGLDTRISQYGSLLVATSGELISNARCSIDSGNGTITTTGNGLFAVNTSTYQTGINLHTSSNLSTLTVYSNSSSTHRSLVVYDNGQSGANKYRAAIYANGSATFAGSVETTSFFKVTNTGIAYLQPSTVTAFQAYESSGPVTINLNNNGTASFASNALNIGTTGTVSISHPTTSARIKMSGDVSGNYTGWKERNVASGSMSAASIASKTPTINDFNYPNNSNGMLIWSTSKIGFAAGSESPQYGNGVQMLFDSAGLILGGNRAFDRTTNSTTTTDWTVKLRTNGIGQFKSTLYANPFQLTSSDSWIKSGYGAITNSYVQSLNNLMIAQNIRGYIQGIDGGSVNNNYYNVVTHGGMGYAGTEYCYGGITKFYNGTGSSTANNAIDPVERFRVESSGVSVGSAYKFSNTGSTGTSLPNQYNIGNVNSNSVAYPHVPGIYYIRATVPCDNTWRNLFTSINDSAFVFHGVCGDASSKRSFSVIGNPTSPSYGVNILTEHYNTGGWNTGSIAFRLDGSHPNWNLQVKSTSYYSTSANADLRMQLQCFY